MVVANSNGNSLTLIRTPYYICPELSHSTIYLYSVLTNHIWFNEY
jgi:hypothetical protein